MKVYRNPLLKIFQYVVIPVVTISGQGATHNAYTPNLLQHIVISELYQEKGTLRCSPPTSPFKRKGPWSWSCFVGPIHSTHIDNKRIVCRVFKPFPEPIISAIWEAERLIGRGRPCPHYLGIDLPPRKREIWGLPWITIYTHTHTHIYIYIYDKYSYIHMSL